MTPCYILIVCFLYDIMLETIVYGGTNMYTLQELRVKLDNIINELYDIEPYWSKCKKCPNHGSCCVGANVMVREDEWFEIKSILDNDIQVRNLVYENYRSGSDCYFRIHDKCLIHNIRPLNCRYTPYQAAFNNREHQLSFTKMGNDCLTNKRKQCLVSQIDESNNYINLFVGEQSITYFLMNNFIINYNENSLYKNETTMNQLIHIYFNT